MANQTTEMRGNYSGNTEIISRVVVQKEAPQLPVLSDHFKDGPHKVHKLMIFSALSINIYIYLLITSKASLLRESMVTSFVYIYILVVCSGPGWPRKLAMNKMASTRNAQT